MKLNKRTPIEINEVLEKIESQKIERYTNEKLPAYHHIPGLTPHPIFDKNGHSYAKTNKKIDEITENNWYSNNEYLYAIDLFNHGYYWETHETLEDFWMQADITKNKIFLQGFIQISAAYLKWVQGIELGMRKLSKKGLLKIIETKKTCDYLFGIELEQFIESNIKFFDKFFDTSSNPPIIKIKA